MLPTDLKKCMYRLKTCSYLFIYGFLYVLIRVFLASFSSKTATLLWYINFWAFKTKKVCLFIKNPVLQKFLGIKAQCSISKFYMIFRFLDFYLRIPKMYLYHFTQISTRVTWGGNLNLVLKWISSCVLFC